MTISPDDSISYYAQHGFISDPKSQGKLFENIPSEVSELCRVIHGLVLHVFWAERYGATLSEGREHEAGIRQVERMLLKLQEVEFGPLTRGRQIKDRLVGNCRTFSVLLASMLQYQGVPARARCGFGRYFNPGWHEDHWVCEYWNESECRWVLVDAQLDEFQCRELDIEFDPLDVPRDQFIVGGKAWRNCRDGEADPDTFGLFEMHGLWFVRGNLIRDIAALNKLELLPWDIWGLIDRGDADISQKELELLDRVASMTYDKVDFRAIRRVYEKHDGLVVPTIIKSYSQSGLLKVDLTTEEVVD